MLHLPTVFQRESFVSLWRDIIRVFSRKCVWVLLGDTNSGKSEFLCMLRDYETSRGDFSKLAELVHSKGKTPGEEFRKVTIFGQSAIVADGPGVAVRKNERMKKLEALIQKENVSLSRVRPCFVVDVNLLSQISEKTIDYSIAEMQMFKETLEKLFRFTTGKKREEMTMYIIGTHLDLVASSDKENLINSFQAKFLENQYPQDLNCFTFKFIAGDVHSENGRTEFMRSFKQLVNKE